METDREVGERAFNMTMRENGENGRREWSVIPREIAKEIRIRQMGSAGKRKRDILVKE